MNQEEQELVKKIYAIAARMKETGHSDGEIIKALMDDGLDQPSAQTVVNNLHYAEEQPIAESSGGGFPGWLVWVLLLVGVNVLSAVFDWGFWLY